MRRALSLLLVGISASLLSGCGSTPQTTRAPVNAPVQQSAPKVEADLVLTPAMMVAKAQDIWQQTGSRSMRNAFLLDAAEAWLADGESAKASQIVYMLRDEVELPEQQNRYHLLIADLYRNDVKVGSSQRLAILQSVNTADPQIEQHKLSLMAVEYARLGQWLAAANALLSSDDSNAEHVSTAWQWVNQASQKELENSARFSKLPAYVSLRQLILEHGFEPEQLKQQLARFQQVFRDHPLVNNWPDHLSNIEQLGQSSRENIVVMLPLSGRLEVTGTAIKEGILAAYFNDASTMNATVIPQLHFVDTVGTSADELATAASDTDWIIGPLLKENVDALLPKLNPQQRILTLNRPETSEQVIEPDSEREEIMPGSFATQVYYALAPEDEARQLAERVFTQGRRSPILVASENTLHQRMQDAFLQRWQLLTRGLAASQHSAPTLVTYSDNNTLREGILEALDVAQSKDRIKEIQSFADVEVYNLARNRRDIDAVVVFTSPEQTELVNPVIEASISPFGGVTVPVFATSRSIDYVQSRNQWRDLDNLHFLDMPWVLPGNPAQTLARQSEQLWPQRPTPLQRLFAFGVDAYDLLPRLNSMAWLPQLEYRGLTGNLSVNQQNEIVRSLPEAVVSQERVQVLAE
ncbi:penicillin-binding protein activator [Alteromonas lipolytica]|uniref:Penicillin-binding protein activator n=1 Tax=Alteromonas lipolytica TaxID=1856405 RepID=A0A1E8F9W4_9ALTE|nr:penicillin-binding protein activator [Alteromonas lipolytica]OFI32714.1 hypothetical protein BFC17_06055 [Alteromonas lipolytica]GGF73805.1 penicillin-binding protein activator [Alteromonas lipolytica]